jgi:hypothetical protein
VTSSSGTPPNPPSRSGVRQRRFVDTADLRRTRLPRRSGPGRRRASPPRRRRAGPRCRDRPPRRDRLDRRRRDRPLTSDELLELAADVLVVAALRRSSRRPSPTASGSSRGEGPNRRSRPGRRDRQRPWLVVLPDILPDAGDVTMPACVGAEQPGHPLGDRGRQLAPRAPPHARRPAQGRRGPGRSRRRGRGLGCEAAGPAGGGVLARGRTRSPRRGAPGCLGGGFACDTGARWVDLEHFRRICETGVTSRIPRPSRW